MSYSATPPGANQTKSFFKASFFRYDQDCYKSPTFYSPSSPALLVFSLHYPLSSTHDLSFVTLQQSSSLP